MTKLKAKHVTSFKQHLQTQQ